MKKILVPLDGSPLSDAALPLAEELATQLHGEIVLITVGELAETGNHAREEAGELKHRLESAARKVKVPAKIRVEESGDASTGILRAIEAEHADLVVMSTHGRSGLSEMAQGSVAREVLRHAKVPVVLRRPG